MMSLNTDKSQISPNQIKILINNGCYQVQFTEWISQSNIMDISTISESYRRLE